MRNIYVINGAPRSGKDTFCSLIEEEFKGYVATVSTVDFVKQIARECGWDGTKDEKNRKFLSDLKDLLGTWDDVPYKMTKIAINVFYFRLKQYFMPEDYGIVFIMCREPEEIERFKKDLGAKTIIIRREEAELTNKSNHADANILNYDYDIQIDNNSDLENLKKEVNKFIIEEKLRKAEVE